MILIEDRNKLLNNFENSLVIAEIGVFKGEFSDIILNTIKPKELHLIDIFDGAMCSGDKDGNNIIWVDLNEEYENLKLKYKENDKVFLHKGMSESILQKFTDNYFDLIYIDGDHTYSGVKKDLEICFNKVKNQGFICGHDYISSKFEGVVRAVNEFCVEKKLNINYLTKDGCPSFCIRKIN